MEVIPDGVARDKENCCVSGSLVPNTPITLDLYCPNMKTKFEYDPEKHTNGCGAEGWKGIFLKSVMIPPDNPMWFLHKGDGSYAQAAYTIYDGDFRKACKTHDVCYSTCSTDPAKRSGCDDDFSENMKLACKTYVDKEGLSGFYALQCIDLAKLYYKAVSNNGINAFYEAQTHGCNCCRQTYHVD